MKIWSVRWFQYLLLKLILMTTFFGCSNNLSIDREFVDIETCPVMYGINDVVNAEVGVAYIHDGYSLKVLSIVAGYGVFIEGYSGSKAFVVTKHKYVDNANLLKGMYVCIGTAQYFSSNGNVCNVKAFEEIDQVVAQKRLMKILEQKRREEEQKAEADRKQELELEKVKAEEQTRIAIEKERERIKREAHEQQLQKIRAEAKAKLEAERIALEKEAKKERLAREKQAVEEATKRYPIEQKQRAEYAALKFSSISYDLKNCFMIQKKMMKQYKSSQVNETSWNLLKNASAKKDWLDVLSIINGEPLKDYPEVAMIDKLYEILLSNEFHAEFVFYGSDRFYSDFDCFYLKPSNTASDDLFDSANCSQRRNESTERNGEVLDVLVCKFSLKSAGRVGQIYICESSFCYKIKERFKYTKKEWEINNAKNDGKLNEEQWSARKVELNERFRKFIIKEVNVGEIYSKGVEVRENEGNLDSKSKSRGFYFKPKKRQIDPNLKRFR